MSAPKRSLYYLATYGCQMNAYDSNLIGGMLEKRGMGLTADPAEADVLIVNTCSIRGGAEDRAYGRIAMMRHYKKRRPEVRIAVIGCMAQNHGERIPVEMDHVDYVVGPDNYRELEALIFAPRPAGGRKAPPAVLTEQDAFENYEGVVPRLESGVSCHITIMRGCNKRCTYCIVPSVRGVERSREAGSIVEEARRAVGEGIKEICLLGQTVNSYRTRDDDFASLLRKLNGVEGLERIRFTSPHPRHFDTKTILAMAESAKVCRHVHLPLQSGSNAMLRKMRRQYTRERFLDIVAEIRGAIPAVGLTTDIITGFVGESERDFEDTLSLVDQVGFDQAFMFSYSPREGTPAFAEAETLTPREKQERHERLMAVQSRHTERNLEAMVGRTEEILIEDRATRNASEWFGKTSCFKRVNVRAAPGLAKGSLVKARILSRTGLVLQAEVAEPGDPGRKEP
jgi:tRNA-2-methylthio-N6-dimethylallyladenosine synthase